MFTVLRKAKSCNWDNLKWGIPHFQFWIVHLKSLPHHLFFVGGCDVRPESSSYTSLLPIVITFIDFIPLLTIWGCPKSGGSDKGMCVDIQTKKHDYPSWILCTEHSAWLSVSRGGGDPQTIKQHLTWMQLHHTPGRLLTCTAWPEHPRWEGCGQDR